MSNALLTVIIPSGGPGEKFFRPTIEDVLAKGVNVEVYAVTDGWVEPADNRVQDDRVTYLELPHSTQNQKRHAINLSVERCAGEYVMALDAHCLMAEGFDEVLQAAHQPNWVQIPRRHRLDAENWCLQEQYGKPPIDYEYFMWQSMTKPGEPGLHGYKWDARTLERWDVPIDRTATCQGSCWYMTRAWYLERGFMQVEGYTGWGAEAEEICLETFLHGGQVMTNKHTWYAHLHKGHQFGRMYILNHRERHASYDYSYRLWVQERREFFVPFIRSFPLMPNWPEDWERHIYGGTA